MSNLIALYSSAPSSGKSEVADILINHHGYHRIKLAKTLKSMVTVMLHDFGIPMGELHRYIEGDLKEVIIPGLGVSPRYLFQTLGTEWGRQLVKNDVWTLITTNRIKAELAQGHSVVVDDLRFPNEFEALQGIGGTMVRVARPGHIAQPTNHVSEGLLDDTPFEFEVYNDGSLADLKESTQTLMSCLPV